MLRRATRRLHCLRAQIAAGDPADPLGAAAERDFIGYGGTPPDPKWPGGKTVALNFVINVEEGSEPSIPDGDGATTSGLVEPSAGRAALPGRDLAAESMFEYGSRAGFWRLVGIFEKRDQPVTLFACALALERNPPLAARVRQGLAAGRMDICCHGYRWEEHYQMTSAQERERISMAVSSLKKTTGQAPDGWYCRYGPSINTRRLVLEHGGFLYDSDSYADDLPYWKYLNIDGVETAQLVVPYSLTNNDGKFSAGGVGTSDDFFAFCKHSIDQLREEAAEPGGVGRMMSIGLHQRLMGHPARARAVGMILDYCATCPDVWVTTRKAIATHWREKFPPIPVSDRAISSSGRSVSPAAMSSSEHDETKAKLSKFAMAEADATDPPSDVTAARNAGDETEAEKTLRQFQEADGYDATSFSAWESHQDEIRVQVDAHVVRVSPLATSNLPYTERLPNHFGAMVKCDLNEVVENPQAFEAVRAALHEYGVLIFRKQHHVHPSTLAVFTHKFDEASPSVWRDLKKNPWELEKAKDGPSGDFMIPGKLRIDEYSDNSFHVDVSENFTGTIAIGQAELEDHYGLTGSLGGTKRYGAISSKANSQVVGGGVLQWHVDGAFYGKLPPAVTALQCVEAPVSVPKAHSFDDAEPLQYRAGSTAYVSATAAYDLCTKDEQDWALGVKVHYMKHPFKVTAGLAMTDNGLRVVDDGRDYPFPPGPHEAADSALQVLPLVWTHHVRLLALPLELRRLRAFCKFPATGRRAIMVNTRCMLCLELADGSMLPVNESRMLVEKLMRRGVETDRIYAHAWEPGDVVLADNWACWHSATGGLGPDDRRPPEIEAGRGAA